MKRFFLFLLLLPLFFSLYGTATFSFEKSWTITGEPGASIDMNGTFLVDNSEQHLLSMEVSHGEFIADGENIFVHYTGKLEGSEMTITAHADIETNFKYAFKDDFSTPAVNGQGKIQNIVKPLLKESLSSTLLSLTEWTNDYITYDLEYADISDPYEVLEVRKGVCVAYSNLFRELVKSLELESRGISGYVVSGEWQFHSWVEVKLPNGEWLSVDPTFGEIGILTSEHIKSYKYADNNIPMDVVSSLNGSVDTFTSNYYIIPLSQDLIDHTIYMDVSFDEDQVYVKIKNTANSYVFVPYTIQFPEGWGKSESKFLLIKPKEEKLFTYPLDTEDLELNYQYNIPFVVSIFGQGETFEVSLSKKDEPEKDKLLEGCPLLFLLVSATILYWGNHV